MGDPFDQALLVTSKTLTPNFDRWRFCEEHNVQLRDEYDQIHNDLAPHWAL